MALPPEHLSGQPAYPALAQRAMPPYDASFLGGTGLAHSTPALLFASLLANHYRTDVEGGEIELGVHVFVDVLPREFYSANASDRRSRFHLVEEAGTATGASSTVNRFAGALMVTVYNGDGFVAVNEVHRLYRFCANRVWATSETMKVQYRPASIPTFVGIDDNGYSAYQLRLHTEGVIL